MAKKNEMTPTHPAASDPNTAYAVRKLGKLVRVLLNVLAKKYLGKAEIAAIEREAGVDLNGDGKIGSIRAFVSVIVFFGIIAGFAFAASTIQFQTFNGDATHGTFKVVDDGAGTATLTVDALAGVSSLSTNQTFLSETGVTNTMVIVNGIITAIN